MIELPPSKSIGARYLVATFFNGTLPADPLFEENDDLMVLQQALLEVYSDEEPIDYGDSPIDVGASGTALRFVTALCASTPGADYVITGTPRLMERPMDPLLNVLREAGAGIQCLGENDHGPYRVTGNQLIGGEFSIRGDISSQFISALMLVAPSWEKGLKLFFSTPLVSRPYIQMTEMLLRGFGIETKLTDAFVEVKPGKYKEPKDFRVEADWSSAAFFYEACVLGAGNLEIANLQSPYDSMQGDSAAVGIFTALGVESEFTEKGVKIYLEYPDHAPEDVSLSMGHCPDLVLPFAVASLCRDVKFEIGNIAHLHLKESDRIKTLQTEARKLGFVLETGSDFIKWEGETCEPEPDPLIETYDDHRLAMSFAMAALKTGKIRISHPEVVEKSFIDFWNQLPSVGLKCSQEGDVMTVEKV